MTRKPKEREPGVKAEEALLARPVNELKGDEKNIAVLARAFHGVSVHATRTPEGRFVEPQK